MNWKQIKTDQEKALEAAIRGLLGAAEEIAIVAEVSEQGCLISLPQSELSMIQFEWCYDTPLDLACTMVSGTMQSNPPALMLTPSSVTLSALAAIRATIAAICAPAEETSNGGSEDEPHVN